METKKNALDMEGIWQRLGFLNGIAVSSEGASGGLALFWRVGWNIQLVSSDFNNIIVRFIGDRFIQDWIGCFTYAPPKRDDRLTFWNNLGGIMDGFSIPWMVMGDLNSVLTPEDKFGGREVTLGEGEGLRNFIFNNGAIDLVGVGALFTWTNGQEFEKLIRERDRDCRHVIEEAWKKGIEGFHSFILCRKLHSTTSALTEWNKVVFGHCQTKIKLLEKALSEVQNCPPSKDNLELEGTIMLELDEVENRLESIWKQKSRECWLKEGDKNSRFFHASIMVRRKRNHIWAIRLDNGDIIEDRESIVHYFRSNFKVLFNSSAQSDGEGVGDFVHNGISDAENDALCFIPLADEIKKVVWALPPLKSPGPDGFPVKFFKTYWDVVGDQVVEYVKEFFHSGKFCKEINKSFIVLIPKKQQAECFDDFRPISLCNTTYKIVAKLLANRLSGVLDKLISPFQAAFIKGRCIAENSIIANEIVRDMMKRRGNEAFVGIKCDMSKAYDRLEWGFLLSVLKAFEFNEHFCKMIMCCVTSVSFQVLINGGLTTKFSPNRGVRQGDPLSPLLFILCGEVLSRMISAKEEEGSLYGFRISPESQPISHLMYADDLVVFVKADSNNVETFLDVMNTYCRWSGQQINGRKSKIIFSKYCSRSSREDISAILGFEEISEGEKFLRNPLLTNGKRSSDFEFIVEKLSSRLEGWRAKLLSQAARTTLIKSVLASIPIYTMSVYMLPRRITNKIDGILRKFWWTGSIKEGRYLALKAWDSICKPKVCGGLGIRKAADINFCLISKLGWLMASDQFFLWKTLLLDKYCNRSDFFSSNLPALALPVAKGIWATKNFIADNIIWLIGRESKVNIWSSWSGGDGLFCDSRDINPRVNENICVGDLMVDSGNDWNYNLVSTWFRPDAVKTFKAVDFNSLKPYDTLCWKSASSGNFSIKNAYWDLNEARFSSKDEICSRIWKINMYERLKLFLWKMCQEALPFGSKLQSIFESCPGPCSLCGDENGDTVTHFAVHCIVTNHLWFASKWNLHMNSFLLENGRDVADWLVSPPFSQNWSSHERDEFTLYGPIVYHKLWSVRNDMFHNKTPLGLEALRSAVDKCFNEHMATLRPDTENSEQGAGIGVIRWGLPRPGRVKCFVNYASNSDRGAVAAVLFNHDGFVKCFGAKKVNIASVLHGELEALLFGLWMAGVVDVEEVDCFSDCQLLVHALADGSLLP
ncbi:uncharacterized protein LOC133039423 [Cannabis sativa]|uniref:uncharacterized protein LOC133039423 n=1 Tax=Cannabis sativa TaxID=3483 RepID=UPI0029C9BD84|nr:uncharacterized protein LOC133039423 [Cannabis sativa]